MHSPVLVIGSGVAGLSYALKVADRFRVALVTKKEHTESNTNYAQGGIAAVTAADDSPSLHIQDTLTAGAGLCHRDAVEQMVCEGPQRVRELMEWGARFSRGEPSDGEGPLSLGREGGHSRRRIIHAQDRTGREVERALVTAVQEHPNVTLFEFHSAVDLITRISPTTGRPHVRGATVLDSMSDAVTAYSADVTALATGGCGEIYLHTTNPSIATGDGVAMAYRAGASVANMEFIQFHPTTLYHPEARSFLISEAVRGEGGILRLQDGTPFMERYHPLASLAPRDIVARAIDAEMKATGDSFVHLDLTHLEGDEVRERFPHIYENCLRHGIDITTEPIPIVPAAHYSCGGVLTDLCARTTLEGLFAVGEVACTGVHGANRLASNSLLEALVFAHHAAVETFRLLDLQGERGSDSLPSDLPENDPQRLNREVSSEFVAQLRVLLRTLMWSHVGIVRSDRRLAQAFEEVSLLRQAIETLYGTSRVTPELLELRNIAQVAELIIGCALRRKESRGLHYNVDHPARDDVHWSADTVFARDDALEVASS